jgi:hypothetical protein
MVWYCTREDVQVALDSETTARNFAQLDREIESASRGIEGSGSLHRTFYPITATRSFDWPRCPFEGYWRIWLMASELISATSVTVDGTPLSPADYTLEPANDGPPFHRIDIPILSGVDSPAVRKDAVVVAGVFAGAPVTEKSVGVLAANLAASESATASVTFSTARVGVGDLLRIDAERMVVTAKTMVDSTQNLQGALTDSNADVTVPVTDGTAFAAELVLLIDSERMLVVDIAGNNLTVKRAWDGSVLAAHTSPADIYTLTGIELDRAELGTALALHNSGAVLYQWQVPGPVKQLAIAEVLNTFEQESSAYARTVGDGETLRNASGAGIADIRRQAYASHGRKLLTMVT